MHIFRKRNQFMFMDDVKTFCKKKKKTERNGYTNMKESSAMA